MRNITYGIGGYDETKPNNNLIEEIDLPDPPQQALSQVGALTTLLVVTGVLTLEDGANALGLSHEQLICEAQAWYISSLTKSKLNN